MGWGRQWGLCSGRWAREDKTRSAGTEGGSPHVRGHRGLQGGANTPTAKLASKHHLDRVCSKGDFGTVARRKRSWGSQEI